MSATEKIDQMAAKGDSRSSKIANIILPGLMIKRRWTSLCLQAKYSRLRLFNLGEL